MAVDPAAVPLRHRIQPPNGLLAALLRATGQSIVCLDAAGRVLAWTQGAQTLYGYSSAEAAGRYYADLVVPEDGRADEERMRLAILAGGEAATVEARRRRKDGRTIDVLIQASPIEEDGRITGLCLAARDAARAGDADLQSREEELARLQERDKVRTEFLTEATHELNTPLTPIRLQVQLLKAMQGLSPSERSNVEAIERNVLRLGLLVQDMLDAGRLQAGRFQLDRARLDLGRLIEEAAGSFRGQAEQQGLRLVVKTTPHLYVDADPTRAMQVLFNLLSNSIKFTKKGGEVEVGARREGDMALAWVRDTGIGLTPEQIRGLFRPFGRVHEMQKGIPKGTGLGLFISKGIIEQHGGQVSVASPGPEQGSTWSFTLPLATSSTPRTPTQRKAEFGHVVDDAPTEGS